MPKPKTAPRSAKGSPALRLARIRDLHVYISAFVAPSLIFFAATGAFQTFRIPDQKTSPVALQKLARLHKDDVFAVKPPRPERPKGKGDHDRGERAAAPAKPAPKPATEALKWFFTATSIGMILSTMFGIWMALVYHKRRVLLGAVILAGAAIPAVLAAFAT